METTRTILQVARREINYIRLTAESYDGMAVVGTIDPHVALIEIRIAPGCEGLIGELLKALKKKEGIQIIPVCLETDNSLKDILPNFIQH